MREADLWIESVLERTLANAPRGLGRRTMAALA